MEDNTGSTSQLPILMTEQGELRPVTDYLLKLQSLGASETVFKEVIKAVSLLLDYLEANKGLFKRPDELFQLFSKRLYTGTIGDDGLDPTGLYWLPTSINNANRYMYQLTALTDWLVGFQNVNTFNPLREATPHEQRLNYAAWFRKNQHDFLGHIRDKSVNKVTRMVRTIKGQQSLSVLNDDAIAFPNCYWEPFFSRGIGAAKDPRVAIRDKLVALLMHGGGLRECEAIAIWVTDVLEDPKKPEKALVRVYDELEGKAPYNWSSVNGKSTRAAFLKEEFARIPRKRMFGTARVGWKSRVVDHRDNYIQVQWFPSEYGKVFMVLWKEYQKYRASIDSKHPYAFISFHPQNIGSPYTLNAFHQNYKAGLRRIGLEPNKWKGLGPHGHRHSYGRRLESCGVHPLVIKRCMHHKSLVSQLPYTAKGQKEISDLLAEATSQLNGFEASTTKVYPDWGVLLEHGFEDIDPQGLFSGKFPKFRCLK